jgi:hypothetical protein
MSPTISIRWSGVSAIAAGVLFALAPLVHPNHDPDGFRSAMWIPAHLMLQGGVMLALFPLIGTFALQLRQAGWLGLVGFLGAFIGTALMLSYLLIELYIIPFLGLQAPNLLADDAPPPGLDVASMIMQAIFTFGYVALGAAIVRARVLPRAVGLLLPIGGLAMGPVGGMLLGSIISDENVAFAVSGLAFGLALASLGAALWTSTPARQRLAAPVAPARFAHASEPAG